MPDSFEQAVREAQTPVTTETAPAIVFSTKGYGVRHGAMLIPCRSLREAQETLTAITDGTPPPQETP